MDRAIERNVRLLARLTYEGSVVPFLGAGVNLMSREPGEHFVRGRTLPSGAELATELARFFEYPEHSTDLMKVSQYVDMTVGSGELYDRLHRLFDADYPAKPLHRLLASLPSRLRSRGEPGGLVIVTTNYDSLLEGAFSDAGEPFDLVYYVADGPESGRFRHVRPDGSSVLIERPNEYDGLHLDERAVIAKIHGAVNRVDPDKDSFVITEDHYIQYLTRTDISDLIPVQMASRLKRSHFLFLGYAMRDWNARVILHRIWAQQRHPYNSWAVQLDPDPIDTKWWDRQGVELIPCRLDEYVEALTLALDECEVGDLR